MFGRLAQRFDFRVECGADSHLGHVRKQNQDAWHADADAGVFVLADGMGGQAAGDVAAKLAVRIMSDALDAAANDVRAYAAAPSLEGRRRLFSLMRAAAEEAHARVVKERESRPELQGMGATLDAVLFAGDRAFVLHVGDARVYLVRPEVIVQLTNDHDVRAVINLKGSLPPPTRTTVPNRLLNAVGAGSGVVCDFVTFEIATGDRLILCTDGVHQMIIDEAAMARRGGRPLDAARDLVATALARGGRDNATAIVVDVRESRVPRKAQASASRDLDVALACPLLADLPRAQALRLLAAAVEVEITDGKIPRVVTRDRVSYIVLDGEVRRSDGIALGAGAVLYPESLVDARRPRTFEAASVVRALRIRADDFRELCGGDPRLAALLYERLARHLAHIDR